LGQASSKIIDPISKEILRKIDLQRKLLGMSQEQFSLKMEKSPQWLTKVKQDRREFKVNDLLHAGGVLNINPCQLLPDNILENLNSQNIETAIKVLTNKGYRIILEESEQKERMSDDKG